MDSPKILVFDIETAPVLAYVWALWKQNVGINQIERDTYILCWAAKWLGDDAILSDALPNHKKHYRKDPESDEKICGTLWELLDEADLIVAHNGDRFDIPRAYARFIHHGMEPPSPAKTIDTYKIAKQVFNFTSNKLDHIGNHLGVGRKVHTDGFDLWRRVMQGDPGSWDDMVDYCRGDVDLLERVYLRMRPWAKSHPNVSAYADDYEGCRACGGHNFVRQGFKRTLVGKFQQLRCKDCGHWQSDSKNLLDKEQRAATKRGGHDA